MKSALVELMTGLDEVEAFLAGERKSFKVYVTDVVGVKASASHSVTNLSSNVAEAPRVSKAATVSSRLAPAHRHRSE